MLRKITLLALLLIFFVVGFNAKAYKVTLNVKGATDSVAYLAHHFSRKQYVIDTADQTTKGTYIFEKDEKLKGGIYLVFFPSNKYFEFVVDGQTHEYTLKTDMDDLQGALEVPNSKENELFLAHSQFMSANYEKQMELKKELDAAKAANNKSKQDDISEKMQKLEEERKAFINNMVKENPNSFWANVLQLMQRPDVPEAPADADSLFAYKYYKSHFFDGVDWTDERLMRTPIFEGKINEYMDKLVIQLPDSLKKEAEWIVNQAYAGNKELFKYTLIKLAHKYETSKIMGQDAVFVHLAEKFYLTKKADWIDSAMYAKIYDRVAKMKFNQLNMKAQELILTDTADQTFTLHQNIKAPFTVVVFWESTCGHCKKKLPALRKTVYDKYEKDGLAVVAVSIERDTQRWKKFLREKELFGHKWYNGIDVKDRSKFRIFYDIYSTPVIYLLDEDKKILAKRLDVEQLGDLLDRLYKDKNSKAGTKKKKNK